MNTHHTPDRRERPPIGFSAETERCRAMLSDNRALYQRMSAMTRNGVVPTIAEVHKFHNGATAPKVS